MCTSAECPGGHSAWGDIPHGGTIHPPTPAYGSPPILGPGGPICLGNWVPLPRQVGPSRTEMPRCKKLSRTQMPRQPGPPRTQLAKYILMYKHFTDKARDHRRPLDETQGGGGGGGAYAHLPCVPQLINIHSG